MRGVRALVLSLSLAVPCVAASCHAAVEPAVQPAVELPPRPAEWRSRLDVTHPLVGKTWDAGARAFVDDARLIAAARAADFVLLGEKHDNEDHHRLQAWIVTALVLGHRRPTIAFEQLDTDQQTPVSLARAGKPHDLEALHAATSWDTSGWPPWSFYEPIFRAADGLELAAANVPHATARRLVREGIGAFEDAQRLGLDQPLPPALDAALRLELKNVHCGMAMPPKIEDGMVLAERARDASMADVMRAHQRDGVVLIAGTGHTRTDRGVPRELARIAPARTRVSIAFVEVDANERDPVKYGAAWGAPSPPFDFVVFTPRANDDDPCAGMRKAP